MSKSDIVKQFAIEKGIPYVEVNLTVPLHITFSGLDIIHFKGLIYAGLDYTGTLAHIVSEYEDSTCT
jgi:hypothetical protein